MIQPLWSARAEMLLGTGNPALATQRTTVNLRICEDYVWNEDAARCHRVLAACALTQGELDDAEAELSEAEPVFQSGQMLFEFAQDEQSTINLSIILRYYIPSFISSNSQSHEIVFIFAMIVANTRLLPLPYLLTILI